MSLFRDAIRPPSITSDEAVRRYVEALSRPSLDPDPLFRRRLRGEVVNRFVATREGMVPPNRAALRGPAMGRLGRACLYASVMLAASVGSAMAASQAALPGDLLYPLKRQVEGLRWHAMPAQFHDELAVYVLTERINELGQLAEAGRWNEAATLAGSIGDAYHLVDEIDGVAAANGIVGAQIETLNAIIGRLPDRAQAAVAQAMAHAPGLAADPGPAGGAPANGNAQGNGASTGSTNDGGANNDGTNGNGSTNNGGANNDGATSGGSNQEPGQQGPDPDKAKDKKGQGDPKERDANHPGEGPPDSEEASPTPSP